jgi:hypothetical protein
LGELIFRTLAALIFFLSVSPARADKCITELTLEPIVESGVLMQLLREYRSMSYVSQTQQGMNPQRTVRANASLLNEAHELTPSEIAFIRGRERKFHLTDDEIADFYFVKIVGAIYSQKSRMLGLAARTHFVRLKGHEPSRVQLRWLQASLRVINWPFDFISGDDLDSAAATLAKPLRQFSDRQLDLIASGSANQAALMEAGLEAAAASGIEQILTGQTRKSSPCCRAFVSADPCAGCGLNAGYSLLERERAKNGTMTYPSADQNTAVPKRLFIYSELAHLSVD